MAGYFIFFGFAATAFIIPMLATRWKPLAWIGGLIGMPLLYMEVEHRIATSQPNYDEGPLGFIGIFIGHTVSLAFLMGFIIRSIMLFNKTLKDAPPWSEASDAEDKRLGGGPQ